MVVKVRGRILARILRCTREGSGHSYMWVDHDLVFCNKQGGFIVHTTLLYHFSKLLKEAGLPQVRFHDLRHSAATLLLSMGVPAKVVQELLGHSKIGMTLNTYSHVLPSMQKDAVDKMEGFLRH